MGAPRSIEKIVRWQRSFKKKFKRNFKNQDILADV